MNIICESTSHSYLNVVEGVQIQLLEHKFLIFQDMFLNVMCLSWLIWCQNITIKKTKFIDLTSEQDMHQDSYAQTKLLRCELYPTSKPALGCTISKILVTNGCPIFHNWQRNGFKYIQSNWVYWTTDSILHMSLTYNGHNSITNMIKLQVLYEVIKLGTRKIHKCP